MNRNELGFAGVSPSQDRTHAHIWLWTPSGQSRHADMDEKQLLELIISAGSSLQMMRKHREGEK